MKVIKSLIVAVTLFTIAVPFAFADIDSISQTSLYTGHYQATGGSGFADPNRGYFFTNDTSAHGATSPYGIGNVTLPQDKDFSALGFGTYSIIVGNSNGDCLTMNLAGCEASMISNSISYTLYHVTYEAAPVPAPFTTMIHTATTTFENSLGFDFSSPFTWMAGKMLIVAGSGLGMLQVILPLIIALVTISAIVYFLYRAFRFYKH